MARWQDDLYSLALSDGTEQEIFDRVSVLAKELGFYYCAYGLQMPIPVNSPKVFMVNNYPDAWRQQYANAGYLAIDPTVRHGRSSMSPIAWSARDPKGHRDFWEDAIGHNISHGWCQSAFTRTGIGGLLTLSRSSDPITVDELTHKETQLRWLVSVTHESMAQRQVGRLNKMNPVQLSARERKSCAGLQMANLHKKSQTSCTSPSTPSNSTSRTRPTSCRRSTRLLLWSKRWCWVCWAKPIPRWQHSNRSWPLISAP